jgi:hypothetical protein
MHMNLLKEVKSIKIQRKSPLWALVNFTFFHNYNYLLLAIIVICNATIIPIDAIIGNNKELS